MRRLNIISLLLLLAFSLKASPASAQSPADLTLAQAASMPAWTVPVLRLVSATHVEPTTGIVLSDTGVVLVPAEFAGPGDELVVLDGGTDIIRNGRPARLLQRFTAEGLQALSVPALDRVGVTFSAAPLTDGNAVYLSAFPPAELIAEGEAPLHSPSVISVAAENGKPRISGDNPLPNVSGALVDDCGYLVGYSSASGVQSMAVDEFPRYQWKETLVGIAGELQLDIREAECEPAPEPKPTQPEPQPEPEPEPQPEPEPEPAPEEEAAETEEPLIEEQPEEAAAGDAEETSEEETATDETEVEPEPEVEDELSSLPPDEIAEVEPQSEVAEGGLPVWLWLVGALVLLAAAVVVHRIRSRDEPKSGDAEPETAEQLAVAQPEAGVYDPPPIDSDSELLVRGQLTSGEPISMRIPVSSQAINLTIGRGSAEIPIDSPAISRRHAELNGNADSLTLSDLGSSNGTSVNGVPCLEGETFYVRPGDTIIVGDARIHLAIAATGKGSAKDVE